ncbi:hypothetical protein BpHYR1_023739 [Brachionus plicatilis]|uniref:Uncharacterized protein n=1 Tax=Brachionus plicatilis TaxID=10195 RepID=A0A3M7RQQ7_BRAPC|nr:hypothetical protein BpHYR1_023739 [Brachionus plicatilis]
MEPISCLKMQIKSRISEDRPERKNGSRRAKISFPKEVENIIGSLSGTTIMYKGHNIAKFPLKDTICEKYHQKGYLTIKCSIAEKLKSHERKMINFNDLYIDQEETQSIIEAEQKDNDEHMMPKTYSESYPQEKE